MRAQLKLQETQLAAVAAVLKGFKSAAPRAVSRAINHTLTFSRAEVVRQVRRDWNAKAAAVRQTIKLTKAVARTLRISGELLSTGRPIPLGQFSPSQNKRGVSLLIRKTAGRKTIRHGFRQPSVKWGYAGGGKRTTRSGGQVGTLGNFGPVVIRAKRGSGSAARARSLLGIRSGADLGGAASGLVGRLPLDFLYGPSVPAMIENPAVFGRIQEKANTHLVDRLNHEVENILQGITK